MPSVWVQNGFGVKTRKPYVSVHEGDWVRQFTPQEARALAQNLIECAEASEQDAFIVHWAMEEIGVSFDKAAVLLNEFRIFREKTNGNF